MKLTSSDRMSENRARDCIVATILIFGFIAYQIVTAIILHDNDNDKVKKECGDDLFKAVLIFNCFHYIIGAGICFTVYNGGWYVVGFILSIAEIACKASIVNNHAPNNACLTAMSAGDRLILGERPLQSLAIADCVLAAVFIIVTVAKDHNR